MSNVDRVYITQIINKIVLLGGVNRVSHLHIKIDYTPIHPPTSSPLKKENSQHTGPDSSYPVPFNRKVTLEFSTYKRIIIILYLS